MEEKRSVLLSVFNPCFIRGYLARMSGTQQGGLARVQVVLCIAYEVVW
jgi:hypothetical protein